MKHFEAIVNAIIFKIKRKVKKRKSEILTATPMKLQLKNKENNKGFVQEVEEEGKQ